MSSPIPALASPTSPTPSGLSIALAKAGKASPAIQSSSSSSASSSPAPTPTPASPVAAPAAAPAVASAVVAPQPAQTPKGAKKPVSYAKANRDFDRPQVGATPYLKIKKGDVLTILKKAERGWWLAMFNGKTGYVPQVCVDEVPDQEESSAQPSPPKPQPVAGGSSSTPTQSSSSSTLSGSTISSSPVKPIVVSLSNSGPRPVQNNFQLSIPVSGSGLESPIPGPPSGPEPSSPIPPPPAATSSSSSSVSSPIPPPSNVQSPFSTLADEGFDRKEAGGRRGRLSEVGESGAPAMSAHHASAPVSAAPLPSSPTVAPVDDHLPSENNSKDSSPLPSESPLQAFSPTPVVAPLALPAQQHQAQQQAKPAPSSFYDSKKSKSVMVSKPNQVYTQQYTQQLFQQDSKDATELGDDDAVDRFRIEKLVKLELGPQGLRYRVLYRGVDGRAYVGWKPSTYFTQHCASALAAFAEFASTHPTGFH